MPETVPTRRSFIGSAAAGAALLGPVALLGGCGTGGGSSSLTSVVDKLLGQASLSTKTESDVWESAIGQSFRFGGENGPVYASLTSVTAQPLFGDRPDDLRQKPLMLSFTLDAGYDTLGDEVYYLDRTMANESKLFMQRGTTANGRPELLALLN
ncbi:hypothetical protein [Sphingomonas sp. SUN039]|uniref:hypothetical protein n=1 Tax=Sphingomonas sp. SUN039 TaxID=2937787 RepID=UPI0021644F2B|nr:hypothetical protein [Sphingomonas sp. SUN039]UVO54896.1 hypothetical protein M0209_12460 [Sphingomonas sp. SUN039]